MKRLLTLVITLATVTVSWAQQSANYKVDPVHSAVVFRIMHAGVSFTYGRFNDLSGSVDFNPANPAGTTFNLTIKAASIDTGNAKRDEHLRSPDFFNAVQFPTITFKSTDVEAVNNTLLKVTGNLTLLGVTKPVTVQVRITGHRAAGPPLGTRAGFESFFTIKRSEFGMTYGIENGGASDEVLLVVSLESIKQ